MTPLKTDYNADNGSFGLYGKDDRFLGDGFEESDARHIVHCVNSHAKLVAALELIRDESHLGADYICKVASDALATLQAEEK